MAAVPLITELLINGVWTIVNDGQTVFRRRIGSGLNITRGRSDWSSRPYPSRGDCTFENADGYFSNDRADSPNYGLLGRNTQLRHRIRWVNDTFSRTATDSWGSADTGQAWTNTGGTSSTDYDVAAGVGTHTHTAVNSIHTSTVDTGATDQDLQADFMLSQTAAASAQINQWLVGRFTDTSNYYTLILSLDTSGNISILAAKRVAGSLTILSTIPIAAHVGGEWWRVRLQVRGTRLRIKAWVRTDVEPDWQYTTTDTSLTSGTKAGFQSRLETGNTNTLPVVFSFDNFEYNDFRFWGETSSFTRRWQPKGTSGADVTIDVEAAGIMRRLGSGAKPLKSAITRAMDGISEGDVVPLAHWPMEEPSATRQFGNLRSGGPATITGDVSPGGYTYTGPFGSDAVPTLGNGGQVAGVFPSTVLTADGSGQSIWQFQFMAVISSSMAANATFLDINVPDVGGDHVIKWRIEWDNTFKILTARPYTSLGTTLTGAAIPFDGTGLYDRPVLFGLSVFQLTVGGLVNQQFTAFLPGGGGGLGGSNVIGAGLTTTIPLPQSWRAYGVAANAGWSFSHAALYTDATLFTVANQQDNADALDGYATETAGDRMTRLCREEGIPFELTGTASDTAAMGTQQTKTLLDLLVDCSEADQGILYEPRDAFGVGYRTRTSLYNQTATPFAYTGGYIQAPLTPVEDDQYIRNDVIVSRPNGSSARVTVDDGPLSTQDPPDGVGTYDESVSLNLGYDDQLEPLAGWLTHLGSWDGSRYSTVALGLSAPSASSIIAQASALDVGDYLSISGLPTWLPPENVELLIQGSTEFIGNGKDWTITWNTVPAGPFKVSVLDSATLGRLEGDHALVAGVNSSATSWIVKTASGPVMTTIDADDGFQWMVDGELVTVTDVALASVTFVSAGTASTGSSGSRTPGLPGSMGAGDLVLIFASTRNSGTGIPMLITNWDQIYLDGNIAVYARIYDGSGAGFMPTVTFSGGAANEDTIAQSCALRGNFASTDQMMVWTAGCLNASAQDITTPGVPVNQLPENFMALYLGWKQDDYTSVATPGSWTEIQEASSTAGNDASQVWGYRQFTATPAAGSLQPSIAVTGGAAAISRGAVILIRSDYQTVTVTRSVNGISKSHSAGAVPQLYPAPHLAL